MELSDVMEFIGATKREVVMKKNKNDQNNGIAIGISLGLIFGLLFDNIAFGLLIGIAFGGLVIKKK